jgi:ribose 5-phosphate isomerase B
VLCLGQRVLGAGLALRLVDVWMAAEFEGGRHGRRVSKMEPGTEET